MSLSRVHALAAKTQRFGGVFRLASTWRSFSVITPKYSGSGEFGKIFDSAEQALVAGGIKDGSSLVVGGFGVCGVPADSIDALVKLGVKDLKVVSNDCGIDDWGLGKLVKTGQIGYFVGSYIGENKTLVRDYLNGKVSVELCPQGTLAERLRAAGAGIPAFYTPTGVGTVVETGDHPSFALRFDGQGGVSIPTKRKETRVFDGRTYLMETALKGDFGLVKAWRADPFGNLQFRGTAMNFNPECAKAGRYTIVEAEELVPAGAMDPMEVHLPGIFVSAIVKTDHEKPVAKLTFRKRDHEAGETEAEDGARARIARRAALEINHGDCVNLGIGIPTEVANHIPPQVSALLQSENGLLGVGPFPFEDEINPDWINAGKQTITATPHASVFSSSESFAMIRGHWMDVTFLGAMEVSQNGDLANWLIPGKRVQGMGGGMDLVANVRKVVVLTMHCDKNGGSKILKKCRLPLTSSGVVDTIITDLAVFHVKPGHGLVLSELAEGVSLDEVRAKTEAEFIVSQDLKTMPLAAK